MLDGHHAPLGFLRNDVAYSTAVVITFGLCRLSSLGPCSALLFMLHEQQDFEV
jgi:hypothetical protein